MLLANRDPFEAVGLALGAEFQVPGLSTGPTVLVLFLNEKSQGGAPAFLNSFYLQTLLLLSFTWPVVRAER